jgi:hypothetical protein
VSVFCSYLRRCGLFITSDWVFLVGWGLLLRCNQVFSNTIVVFVCFIWLLISGVKKVLQNKCHLAAKLGTKLADLL